MRGGAVVHRVPAWRTSKTMLPVPPAEWPLASHPPMAVWCSRDFLVQAYDEGGGIVRLSVNRAKLAPLGGWAENISWDHLQRIKREIGMVDRWAVEVFPADQDVVNVANLRHLWVLPEPPAFGWRKADPTVKEPTP